ncbi:hypothetical protein JW698_03085 [Candidatus Wolfebacteria bacterium]|nr:hypothetical protein [Candidatus Wolfebacteria bacterium]
MIKISRRENWIILTVLFLIIFDIFIWKEILFNALNKNSELYFLDVGQGDSELIILPDEIKILIDAGPNNKILSQIDSIFSPFKRYLDIAIISHAEADHFTGLIDVLKRYQVGAFIFNGQKRDSLSFKELEKTLQENKVATVILKEGDKIKYKDNYFEVLSPTTNLLQGNDLNNASLVIKANIQGVKVLFTGDIGDLIEKQLIEKYDLNIDILKVGHHGSKFSSSLEFLKETFPQIAIIEVGKNSYGHPTSEVLNKLSLINAHIFRTDIDGTIKIIIGDNKNIDILKGKFEF